MIHTRVDAYICTIIIEGQATKGIPNAAEDARSRCITETTRKAKGKKYPRVVGEMPKARLRCDIGHEKKPLGFQKPTVNQGEVQRSRKRVRAALAVS